MLGLNNLLCSECVMPLHEYHNTIKIQEYFEITYIQKLEDLNKIENEITMKLQ